MQTIRYILKATGLIVLGTFVLTVGGALTLPVNTAADIVLAWLFFGPIAAVAYPYVKRRTEATDGAQSDHKELERGK